MTLLMLMVNGSRRDTGTHGNPRACPCCYSRCALYQVTHKHKVPEDAALDAGAAGFGTSAAPFHVFRCDRLRFVDPGTV